MMMKNVEIRRLASALGAEIVGLDLAKVGPEDLPQLQEWMRDFKVLFFPDQTLSTSEHTLFGSLFGETEGHPHLVDSHDNEEKILELRASHGGVADEWHSDLSFLPEPAEISILQMMKCPEVGGDTLWANLAMAFDALSEPMQDFCEGLTALHNAEPHGRPEVMTVHPMVRIHPETGQKVLFVNEHFTRRIVELSLSESDLFLGYFKNWVADPRFSVRYHWREGTVAIWDNRCTQHMVLSDFDGERVIQRVTVMGDKPEGGKPRWSPYLRPGIRSDTSRHDRLLRRYLRDRANESQDKDLP